MSGPPPISSRCPAESVLLGLVAGRVRGLAARGLRGHIDRCRRCQTAVAEAARGMIREESPSTLEAAPRLPLVSGTVIGGYRLGHPVGRGGAGVVWSALRLADERLVAIKFLRESGDSLIRRLEREARLARAVRHPGVVGIHEVLKAPDGAPALVMDLLEGEDLSARLRPALPRPVAIAAAWLLPAMDILAAVHARGIAHRDVKPSNLFFERAEGGATRVRLFDFGLARALTPHLATAGAGRLTRKGMILGTPRYMAPEQIIGSDDVDAAADVWAIGAILYEVLAGQPRISAVGFEEVVALFQRFRDGRSAPLVSVLEVAPATPPGLAATLDATFALAREERPPLEELSAALTNCR